MNIRFRNTNENLCSRSIEYETLTFLSMNKTFFAENSNKGVVIQNDQLRSVELYMNDEDPPFSILKEKIITDTNGFSQYRNSFMFEPINRKVVQFVESGLAQYLVDRYRVKEKPVGDSGPKVLTLEHLNAGYYIFLACISLAVFTLIVEKIVQSISKAWSTRY